MKILMFSVLALCACSNNIRVNDASKDATRSADVGAAPFGAHMTTKTTGQMSDYELCLADYGGMPHADTICTEHLKAGITGHGGSNE